MQYLAIGIRCLVGAVFLASSLSKVAGRGAFGEFVASLRGMRLVPAGLARPAALAVVVTEFAVWVLLAMPVGFLEVVGFVVAAGLLVAFTAGVGLTVRRGVNVPCRCFGASEAPFGLRHAVRNAGLAAVAAAGAVAALAAAGPVEPGGVAVAVFAGFVLAGLAATLDDLFELFRPAGRASGAVRGLR